MVAWLSQLAVFGGSKFGFPVFAMNWADPKTNELTEGFKEKGFLPEAFINLLALLGWNDGTEQEIFSLEELIEKFTMERVHSGGAHFDYEKAKWFNHEWLKKLEVGRLRLEVIELLKKNDFPAGHESMVDKVIELTKERCFLLTDFIQQASFFFKTPETWDVDAVKPKWNDDKKKFFQALTEELAALPEWDNAFIEDAFKKQAAVCNIKPGELQLPLRVMLVGGKFGPPVFAIAEVLGKAETIKRIELFLGAEI